MAHSKVGRVCRMRVSTGVVENLYPGSRKLEGNLFMNSTLIVLCPGSKADSAISCKLEMGI